MRNQVHPCYTFFQGLAKQPASKNKARAIGRGQISVLYTGAKLGVPSRQDQHLCVDCDYLPRNAGADGGFGCLQRLGISHVVYAHSQYAASRYLGVRARRVH